MTIKKEKERQSSVPRIANLHYEKTVVTQAINRSETLVNFSMTLKWLTVHIKCN